jgi:uncharacterized OB-fold protein
MTTPHQWRISESNAKLIGYRCPKCSWVSFPEKKRACKRCGSAPVEMQAFVMKPFGKIVSYVVQHRLPEGFETPLPLAIIEFEEGARAAGHIIDCKLEELHVGFEVEAEYRMMYEENGLTTYSYKFKPRRSR